MDKLIFISIYLSCVTWIFTWDKSRYKTVGPGLAQLVECLTDRYSESSSSNPSNLTSATVCRDRTGCMPATKRSASVTPEVDLGECTLYLPTQKVNKAEPTLALNPRGDITRNPMVNSRTDMWVCPQKNI